MLREDWRQQTTEYDDYDEEDEEYQDDYFAKSIAQDVAPFSRRQFPGLAQAEDHQLSAGQFERVLSGLGPARVGLVPAGPLTRCRCSAGTTRSSPRCLKPPCCAPGRTASVPGSCGSGSPSSASWRGGHRALETAQHLAAEQCAFCHEFGGTGLHDVSGITASLMKSPVWTFWWD